MRSVKEAPCQYDIGTPKRDSFDQGSKVSDPLQPPGGTNAWGGFTDAKGPRQEPTTPGFNAGPPSNFQRTTKSSTPAIAARYDTTNRDHGPSSRNCSATGSNRQQ